MNVASLRLSQLVVAIALAGVSAGTAVAAEAIASSAKVGQGVYEIAVSPSTGTVYAASAGQRNQPGAAIHILAGDTLKEIGQIDTSAAPAYGLGLNDKTQTLYTTNTRAGSVSVIDLKTRAVVKTLSQGGEAHLREAVVDEDSNTIYVSNYGKEGSIWVIDGKTNTIAHVLSNVGAGTSGMAIDKAANRLWVTNMDAGEVAAIDLKTHEVVQRYPAGGERPTNIALDPTTSRLFVANQRPGSVTVLDSKTGKLLGTVTTEAQTLDVEVNPKSGRGYASNRGAASVTVFDIKTLQPVENLKTGSAPNTLVIDATRNQVYVTNKAAPRQRPAPGAAGAAPPAQPAAPAADDPGADTVTLIK